MVTIDTVITWKKGGTRVHVHDVGIVTILHHNCDGWNFDLVIVLATTMMYKRPLFVGPCRHSCNAYATTMLCKGHISVGTGHCFQGMSVVIVTASWIIKNKIKENIVVNIVCRVSLSSNKYEWIRGHPTTAITIAQTLNICPPLGVIFCVNILCFSSYLSIISMMDHGAWSKTLI